MGKRGPKAETKGHLKLRGSPLAKNRPEPVVVSGCPVRPKWLKAKAKKKFEALVEQYTDLPDVVGAIDSELLARYCDTWAWWLKLKGEIKKEGEVITSFNKSGDSYFAANPKVTIHLKLAALLDKMEKELYLTPSARTNLKIKQPKKAVNPLQALIDRRKIG